MINASRPVALRRAASQVVIVSLSCRKRGISERSCGVIEILGVRRVSRLEVRLYIPSSPFSRPAARPSKEVSYLVIVVVRFAVSSSRLRESLRSCFSEAMIR